MYISIITIETELRLLLNFMERTVGVESIRTLINLKQNFMKL